MDQVVTDGMAPMGNGVGGRIALVKEVPLPLPVAKPVGVVQIALRADKMIERPVGVSGQGAARGDKTLEGGVVLELGFLRDLFICFVQWQLL